MLTVMLISDADPPMTMIAPPETAGHCHSGTGHSSACRAKICVGTA